MNDELLLRMQFSLESVSEGAWMFNSARIPILVFDYKACALSKIELMLLLLVGFYCFYFFHILEPLDYLILQL